MQQKPSTSTVEYCALCTLVFRFLPEEFLKSRFKNENIKYVVEKESHCSNRNMVWYEDYNIWRGEIQSFWVISLHIRALCHRLTASLCLSCFRNRACLCTSTLSIKCEPNQCQTQIFQQAYVIPVLIPAQSECGVLLGWRLFVFTHLLLMCLFTSIDDSGRLGGVVCLFCNRATFQHCWSEEPEFWMSHLFWL